MAQNVGLNVGRRQAARLRLSIPARLVTLSDTRRCAVLDLSRTGAQIGLPKPLEKGQGLFLQLAGLDELAEVVRTAVGPNGGTNGIAFEVPLTEEQVIEIRRFAESTESDENYALRREVRAWVSGCKKG